MSRTDDADRQFFVSTVAHDEPAIFEVVPLYQIASYLRDKAVWGDVFEIAGIYEMVPDGRLVKAPWKTGPASGREDVNPTHRLLSVWLDSGDVVEYGYLVELDD